MNVNFDMTSLEDLTVQSFEPLLDDSFLVVEAGLERELLLVEVSEVGHGSPSAWAGRAPFSIVFEDSAASMMPQGIHPLQHESLGRLEIFLVPIQPQDGHFRYQAIFS